MAVIKVITKKPGKNPVARNIINTVQNFENKVGGRFECLVCANNVIMVYNDEHKALHEEAQAQLKEFTKGKRDEIDPKLLPFLIPNFHTGGFEFFSGMDEAIYGPVFFCRDLGDDFGALYPKNIEMLKNFLSEDWVR